jgi:hypothetical protein
MRKPAGALLTVMSAALVIGLGATTSSAATAKTWRVSPGGSISGKAGTTTLKDTNSGTTVKCKTSTMTGSLKKGSGLSGTGLGTVTEVNFNNCTVLGETLSLTSGAVTWALNAKSETSAGVVSGTITGIHISASSSACSLVIDGTSGSADDGMVKVTYTNSTHKLKILAGGGNLHVYDVNGCLGVVSNGDPGTITGNYKITPAQTITES